ncbi:MAG: flagellar M-ring protein FliF, partial [Polaromonas sp.]|nr:flagellar M-ring protein FliF [Polaromonas sp.]
GRSIDEGQVSAIVHLISSSVPELSDKSITVVDQAGNLLSAANSGTRGLDVSQLKYAQEIEQGYIRRIEAILQPLMGTANVHAQVAAEIDFSVVENTDEKYRPNQTPGSAAIRSQQSSDSSQSGASAAGGVPGALSNQPPVNPAAPIAVPAASAASAAGVAPPAATPPGNTRKDGTTNYELDRTIRHVQQGAGSIKRLSVAVVVNYRGSVDAQGKRAAQALTAIELEQVNNLVKEAMGFSADRGDSLNVVNSAFVSDVSETVVLPLWKQPENIELAKTAGQYALVGMLALFAWFALFRPLLRKHLAPPQAALPAPVSQDALLPGAGQPVPAELLAQAQEQQGQRHLENVKYAQDLSLKDPQMIAMLMKHWMDTKNE